MATRPARVAGGAHRLAKPGIDIVDVYLPWGVHEQTDGSLDFGARDPRLDAVRFLNLAHSLGLLAIVRPGPHINAELTYFGIPERVIWNRDCQARSPRGMPVVLPVPPLAFRSPATRVSPSWTKPIAG